MSDSSDQQQAMEPLRAPAGREVVERVTAERLGPPRLHAVDSQPSSLEDRVSELEAQVTEERAARRKAESAANEMAVLIARVRTELAEERSAREAAEATADQMAGLIAEEHARSRKLEEDLRSAWGQIPMYEQSDLEPVKPTLVQRAKRGLKR
jgi:chromosome segregation ATPase